ncbi:hypothetical protein GUJ93_ZPchr0007g3587 [Zizania palustris]|uniref:Uncharacterized protein n=1 Tax=Zizania palustris TaxID=103762 RepID=A0A8J5VUF4_ZIZPA|nr:hypothetical protein GUJ93_ZPchr0007g3587 [Zizania palustris]
MEPHAAGGGEGGEGGRRLYAIFVRLPDRRLRATSVRFPDRCLHVAVALPRPRAEGVLCLFVSDSGAVVCCEVGEKLNSMNLLLYMAPIAVILLLPATIFMDDNVVGNLEFALLNNVMHF